MHLHHKHWQETRREGGQRSWPEPCFLRGWGGRGEVQGEGAGEGMTSQLGGSQSLSLMQSKVRLGLRRPLDARSAPRPVLHCRPGWPVGGDSCLPPSPTESRSQRADAATSRRRGQQANHAAGTHSITKKYSSIYISYICIICIETLPCGNVSTAALLPHVKTPASEAPCLSHRRLLLLLLLPPSSPSSGVFFFASHLKSQTPYATYP